MYQHFVAWACWTRLYRDFSFHFPVQATTSRSTPWDRIGVGTLGRGIDRNARRQAEGWSLFRGAIRIPLPKLTHLFGAPILEFRLDFAFFTGD